MPRDAASEFWEFRDLMTFKEPEYTVPSRRTITARVERMYAEEKKRQVESRKK